MRRFLREPLLHFLLLGGALFVIFGLLDRRDGPPAETIVVTGGQIENLAAGFQKLWQRPPTQQELHGLVRDYLREEVASREAMALGLDRNDGVIRKRLRMKVEFITDDLSSQVEPTDEQLQAYLDENPESFRIEPRFTFAQVYVDPARHGDGLQREAERLRALLDQAGPETDLALMGDRLMLENVFEDMPRTEVVRTFGDTFAEQLEVLEAGRWRGPVPSGYGAHMVLLRQLTPGRMPSLDEVRTAVQRDWSNARRMEARDEFYDALLERYEVVVDWPGGGAETAGSAAEPAAADRTGG